MSRSSLLTKVESAFGTIRVLRAQDGILAYVQNGSYHSQANRRGTSVCVYVHVLAEIIRQKQTLNVLVIGCAGGTLATMLRRQNCKVTVVDINPTAFILARQYFNMPHDIRCIRRCGAAYLRQTRRRYDAIIVDVFGGGNTVPRLFTTKPFFRSVRKALAPDGLMIMNTMTANDKDRRATAIARNAHAVKMNITLFDWPRQKDRNTLIVGGDINAAHIPSGHEPAWIRGDYRGMVRRRLSGKVWRE